MNHIGLFEGVGGFSLAARWMGWSTVAWCEWNPFCQTVLKYHFPEAEGFGDITKTDFTKYANTIDILTGGFPCQPFSVAGKQLGTEDPRHLWPHMLRAIRESRPRWVVGENVGGLINWSDGLVFEQVCAELEAEGYEVQPFILPACGVNAPHRRDRVWFVGYSQHNGYAATEAGGANQKSPIKAGTDKIREFEGADSLQSGIDTHRTYARIENLQFGGKDAVYGFEPTADAPIQLQQGDESRECKSARRKDVQQEYEQSNTEQSGAVGENGIIAHPQSERSTGLRIGTKPTYAEYGSVGEYGDVANPCHQGLQRGKNYGGIRGFGEKREQQPSGSIRTDWSNFPTQPPLRSRNDGFSSELVGITLSKHRNESIKAYGNAIVPQVALQIFKAIAQYEAL